jgi:hypothetical protein
VKLLAEEGRIVASRISDKGFAEFVLKAPLDQITIAFEKTTLSRQVYAAGPYL